MSSEENKKLPSVKKENPTWEIIGVVIGFIGTADTLPILLNNLLQCYPQNEIPETFKRIVVIAYFILLSVACAYLLWVVPIQRKRDSDSKDSITVVTSKRAMRINFFRMFPLSLISKFIFFIYKIQFYDVFLRPKYWGEKSFRLGFFNFIERFYFENEHTLEIQYPTDFSSLYIRETTPPSSDFGADNPAEWGKTKYRWLTLTSWFGIYWTAGHFYLRFLSICYGAGAILHAFDILDLRLHFSEMTAIWKIWIGFLLAADLFAAIGLWNKKWWGEVLFVSVATLQLIAYTYFKDIFGEQQFLVLFHAITILIYFAYLPFIHRANPAVKPLESSKDHK